MRPVLLFDVNETLLDLRSLDSLFERVLGNAALRPVWFAQMLQLSFVGGLTAEYVNFTDAQTAALAMVAERSGIAVSRDDATRIVGAMSSLPAHPEVPAALAQLSDAGFQMATLTNSVSSVAEQQVENAGIRGRFEFVLSADSVSQLKPARAPYEMAARTFGRAIEETILVAAHSWDISGALAAGAQGAFVKRPGAVLSPLGRQPQFVGHDLTELAESLVKHFA